MFNILNKKSDIKKYIVKTEKDIISIPITVGIGSEISILATGEKYILNSQRQWVKDEEEVIYEGGDLSNDIALEEIDYDGGML